MPVQTIVAKRRELEDAIIAIEKMAARSDPQEQEVAPEGETPPAGSLAAPETPALAAVAEEARTDPIPQDLPAPPATRSQLRPEAPAADAVEASPPTAAAREFAPAHDGKKIDGGRGRSIATYGVAAAMVTGVAVVAAMFAGFAIDQFRDPASSGKSSPSSALLQTAPAIDPPGSAAGFELLKGAGFSAAAQDALKQGNGFLARGDYSRAISAFDDAIRLDPGNLAYRLNRAVAYNRVGDHQHAISDLDEVIRIESANFEALSSRCWARLLSGHLQDALADCNEALKLRPKDPNTLDSRGLVFLRLGRLERAIADFDAALRVDPKLASSLYGRGLARIGRADRAGGNEDVAAARSLNPEIQATFARYGIR